MAIVLQTTLIIITTIATLAIIVLSPQTIPSFFLLGNLITVLCVTLTLGQYDIYPNCSTCILGKKDLFNCSYGVPLTALNFYIKLIILDYVYP